jgi:hypothetical protein
MPPIAAPRSRLAFSLANQMPPSSLVKAAPRKLLATEPAAMGMRPSSMPSKSRAEKATKRTA